MSDTVKKDESAPGMNRKLSEFTIEKEGKIFIKDGGGIMNRTEEKDKTGVPPEKTKDEPAYSGVKVQNTVIDAPMGSNIDKIRDIIFGNQMTDYEKRFARLEERMFKEMTVSKSEARENFDSLEKTVRKELDSLKEQIMNEQSSRGETVRNIERRLEDIGRTLKDQVAGEQNARSESVREIERRLKDMTRSFERRIDRTDETLQTHSKGTEQEISELSRSIRSEMRQKYDDTALAIERMVQELRTNKADRAVLADLFMEMAVRITNEK